MKAHKYWSLGALACMAGCFYTGCKKLMQAHKYFACGTLVCMGMAIYSGHKIAPKKQCAAIKNCCCCNGYDNRRQISSCYQHSV